jgi:hypothetical protein
VVAGVAVVDVDPMTVRSAKLTVTSVDELPVIVVVSLEVTAVKVEYAAVPPDGKWKQTQRRPVRISIWDCEV